MAATALDFDLYVSRSIVLELTIKDSGGTVVDVTLATGSAINWIMQKAKDDPTGHVYKDLSDGIDLADDRTVGDVDVTIDPADTDDDAYEDAKDGDLSFWNQITVKLGNLPAVVGEGTVTVKWGQDQVVNIDLTLPSAFDSGSSVDIGTLQTDENLTAPAAADSGSEAPVGTLTVTTGA